MSITSVAPCSIRGALEQMLLLAVESLDAASPVLAMHTTNSLASKVGLNRFELGMRVVVWRARHARDVGKRISPSDKER